jgi:cytochrome c oxidase cbb3-type subunit 4
MDMYSFLRHLADSWALLVLFVIFIGVVLYAFRPGTKDIHRDAANVPFRHDDRPAPATNKPEFRA